MLLLYSNLSTGIIFYFFFVCHCFYFFRSMNLLFHSKFNLEEIKQVLPSLMCHPQYPIIKQSPLFQNLLKESEEV